MRRAYVGFGFVVMTALAGCLPWCKESSVLRSYPPATLETAEDLQYWSRASAPNVYGAAILFPMTVAFAVENGATCPTLTSNGEVDTYQGGCTDDGTTWTGTLTVTNSADGGVGSFRFEEFGIEGTQNCGAGTMPISSKYNGSLVQTPGAGAASSFEIDLRNDNVSFDGGTCVALTGSAAWDYRGQTNSDTDTWSGEGRIGDSERGVVSARTTDEVLGSACSSEATAGTTTLNAGSNTAVITYDGQTDCDTTSTVTWTLNGTAQGEVTGIQCSIGGPAGPSLALLLGGLLAWRRRRSRGDRPVS